MKVRGCRLRVATLRGKEKLDDDDDDDDGTIPNHDLELGRGTPSWVRC